MFQTFAEGKRELRELGITLTKNQHGEYRVNFVGGSEATAYYTDSLDDAVNTGHSMATRPKEQTMEKVMCPYCNEPIHKSYIVKHVQLCSKTLRRF